jgi:hypothetical protein
VLGALFLNASPLLNQESLLNYAHVIRRGRWMADAPEILHTRAVAVPAEQIHAFHVNPVPGSAAGLTATAIEVVAPATLAVPEQSATSTRSIAILLIAATAVTALYAVTSGPFIASVRMS